MGRTDNVTREYIRNPEVFADICNAIIFNGKQVVKAEYLEERDTTEEVLIKTVDSKKKISIQRYRDVLKRWVTMDTPRATIAVFGIENQAEIHYAMVTRSYLYDALNYENQVKYISDMNVKLGKVPAKAPRYRRFLKCDKIKPVITIVVYWGHKEWDGARSLHELVDFEGCEELKEVVQDYKMLLLVPAEIENFDMYKTNLRYVLPFIKSSNSEENMQELLNKHRDIYSATDRTTAELLKVLTNIEIEDLEGDAIDMCKAWDEHKNSGIREGRKEGKESMVEVMLKCKELLSKIVMYSGFEEEQIRQIATRIGVAVVEG